MYTGYTLYSIHTYKFSVSHPRLFDSSSYARYYIVRILISYNKLKLLTHNVYVRLDEYR